MNIKCWISSFAAACLFLALSAPQAAMAVDLIVEHTLTDSSHFTTIQAAINHADVLIKANPTVNNSFQILVQADPAPYSGPITPISNVPIKGTETGRTFITGGTSGPLIAISGVSNVTISNLTILNAVDGISVASSTGVTIRNNIFQELTGTAVQVRTSSSTNIVNNTFFHVGTAVDTDADILITNNIFSRFTKAIATIGTANPTQATYNDYHIPNTIPVVDTHSLPNTIVLDPDPLFVDSITGVPAKRDFHLLPNSPAHAYGGGDAGNPNFPNAGNTNTFDMGVYGGPFRDTVPLPVTGLVAPLATPTSIAVAWNVNKSYQVSGYRVYFGPVPGIPNGTVAPAGSTVISAAQPTAGDTASATISNPQPAVSAPAATAFTSISPKDQALALTWTPAANATSYKIYFSTTQFTPSSLPATFVPVIGGSTTSFTLAGLQNGVTYFLAITAVAQTQVFIQVTAINNAGGPFSPGKDNESALSAVVRQSIGDSFESASSPVVQGFPEAIAPFPNLKNEGCFIATAAYGFYSAPQVQVLREFRDRYLMTNVPGRAFVAWYYHYGPRGAHFINAHPWLKPPVRLALFPLVTGAMFLIHTAPLTKIAIFMIVMLISVFAYQRSQRKLLVHTGGAR